MRNDVHVAALRAAAKLAFSVVLLNGCSTPAEGDDDATSNESAVTSGTASAPKAPCDDAGPAKPAKTSCDAVLATAYPVPGDYQWEGVPQSSEVVACCREELSTEGSMSHYRWDCCVAYDPASLSDAGAPGSAGLGATTHSFACTPWGPPVPPAMNRARRARRAIPAVA